MKTAGIVLCGGRSSRMGRPKAWLPFGGELMLQRIVRILRAVLTRSWWWPRRAGRYPSFLPKSRSFAMRSKARARSAAWPRASRRSKARPMPRTCHRATCRF